MVADLRCTSVQPAVLETLSKTRLRVTPQRLVILRVLQDSADHPSAEMIYREVVREFPRISLKTVYSNLEQFESVGLAHKVITMHGTSRYEVDAGHHAHFICNKCSSIEHDLPGESSLSAVGKIKRADFMISSVAVISDLITISSRKVIPSMLIKAPGTP